MKPNTWTTAELSILKENYKDKGIKFCLDKINYPESKIRRMASKLNLKIDKIAKEKFRGKQTTKCNVNPDLFYNITSENISYFLGLMWADGFLNASKDGRNYNLGLSMIKDDIEMIRDILNSIGKWNYYERKQTNEKWKRSINVVTNNKRIYDFLVTNDYDKKSYISADKILSKIPDNLKFYFFRGLIDGDGCFYNYRPLKGSKLRQFVLTSTYEQDWSYIEKLCIQLNITYQIKHIKNKNSSYSIVRITNRNGIKKMGEYVYSNFENDGVGLYRKYEKYISTIR